jgi:hypothetical protein
MFGWQANAKKAQSALFSDQEANVDTGRLPRRLTRKPIGLLPGLVIGAASAILAASPSFAAPITYTEEATASGSLGGVAFTNADVVVNSDTTRVWLPCRPLAGQDVRHEGPSRG